MAKQSTLNKVKQENEELLEKIETNIFPHTFFQRFTNIKLTSRMSHEDKNQVIIEGHGPFGSMSQKNTRLAVTALREALTDIGFPADSSIVSNGSDGSGKDSWQVKFLVRGDDYLQKLELLKKNLMERPFGGFHSAVYKNMGLGRGR